MQNTPPRPISGPLRQRINKLAHQHALEIESRMKAALLQQVQTARDAGAGFDQLAAMVDNVQSMEDLAAMTSTPQQRQVWAEMSAGFQAMA
ncbi:MAG: hypothetical protein ACOYNZ_08480 [Rhodoferax sp.]